MSGVCAEVTKLELLGYIEHRLNTPAFIPPTLWPPNSPDLNPVDYKIWGVLQERVYKTRIRDVEHLKKRLVEEWASFDQWRKSIKPVAQTSPCMRVR